MVAPFMPPLTSGPMHPLDGFAMTTVRVTDYDTANVSTSPSMAKVSTSPSDELTVELDGATEWLRLPPDEILLAALTRTMARTLGEGVVPVDIASERGCLLDAVPMVCATAHQATATEVLAAVHRTLAFASEHAAADPSEVYFNYIGEVSGDAGSVPETPPALGHALELRVYRAGRDVQVDWWYDTSRFARYTVEELAEQFPLALFEMTSDALSPR